MTVSLIVPVSPDRRPVWDWCRRRWEAQHPDWTIVECPADQHDWCKGAVVNPAIRVADPDEVLVVTDCDLALPIRSSSIAVHAVTTDPCWVMPFGTVYRLDQKRTDALLLEDPAGVAVIPIGKRDGLVTWAAAGRPGGGVIVARARDLQEVGGFDERFVGWGREDISLGVALDTLVGQHVQLDAPLWHLEHPRTQERHSESLENLKLAGRYEEARKRPAAMRALIEEAACRSTLS